MMVKGVRKFVYPSSAITLIVCLRLAGAFAKFQTAPLHRRHTKKLPVIGPDDCKLVELGNK